MPYSSSTSDHGHMRIDIALLPIVLLIPQFAYVVNCEINRFILRVRVLYHARTRNTAVDWLQTTAIVFCLSVIPIATHENSWKQTTDDRKSLVWRRAVSINPREYTKHLRRRERQSTPLLSEVLTKFPHQPRGGLSYEKDINTEHVQASAPYGIGPRWCTGYYGPTLPTWTWFRGFPE